jgi:all-trans-retinol 13,14-reductase
VIGNAMDVVQLITGQSIWNRAKTPELLIKR